MEFKIERNIYLKSVDFITDQATIIRDYYNRNQPDRFRYYSLLNIASIAEGNGSFLLEAPTIVVSLAKVDIKDSYEKPLFTLFHEYGHWLQMRLWIKDNCDELQEHEALHRYNQHISSNNFDSLGFERTAWHYGLKGLKIYSGFLNGLKHFLKECEHIFNEKKIIQSYMK